MKRITLIKLIISLLIVFSYFELTAKPGDLDSSFGENGIVIYKYDSDHFPIDRVGMVVLENQDILAGFNIKEQGYLVKFDKYGNLDKTFGKQGELVLKFQNQSIKYDAFCKDQNGNVYLLSDYMTIYKLNNYCAFDTNFGINGSFYINSTSFTIYCDSKNNVIIPTFGGFIDKNLNFVMIRINENGICDSTFADDGVISVEFGLNDRIFGFSEQSNGKLILYGQACIIDEDDSQKSISKVALCRLFNNGEIDSSFGIDGRVITDLPGKWSVCHDVKIQNDGRILAACSDGPIDKQNTKIIRYLDNGTIDSSFGNYGIANIKAGNALTKGYLSLDDDQNIYCGGTGIIPFGREFIFAQRFHNNGILDSTFGIHGRVEFIVDNGDDLVKNNGIIYQELVDNNIFWIGKMINYNNRISGLLIAKIKTDQPVAVIEQQKNHDIIPYPNPFYNYIYLDSGLMNSTIKHIELIDIEGKRQNINNTDNIIESDGKYYLNIDDNIKPGVYFIKIVTNKRTLIIKALKY